MRARRLASREYSLGFSDRLQADNRLVAGRRWLPGEQGFSVEQGVAKALGIAPGDVLHFDVAGQQVSAPVLNLRTVEWDSFNVNFFVQGSKAVMDANRLPHALITSIYLRQDQEGLLLDLSRRFPAVSAISIGPLLQKVREIVQRGARAVEAVFLFTLGAAILVSLAALQLTRAQREREIALLRTLGASRQQVRLSLLTEFGTIGLLAGLISALVASGLGLWLGWRLFGIHITLDYLSWIAGPLIGLLVFSGMAWLASRPLLSRPPIRVLR
jgi:putative ABC transport system permease protein